MSHNCDIIVFAFAVGMVKTMTLDALMYFVPNCTWVAGTRFSSPLDAVGDGPLCQLKSYEANVYTSTVSNFRLSVIMPADV